MKAGDSVGRDRWSVGSWPLVGREPELGYVRASFGETEPVGVAFLAGSGVGKTLLLRAIQSDAAAAGLDVLEICGVQSNPSVALAPLLPLLPPDAPVAADDGTLYRLLVSQLTRTKPTLITVDDAHLLDQASAAAVNAIASSRTALVVVNARSDLESPKAISALWKDGVVARRDLRTLDRSQVAEVVRQALGGTVARSVIAEAWRMSQGLPLFLHELVVDGVERATLQRVDDTWRLTGPLSPSARVIDIVDRRLGNLTPASQRALAAVALLDHVSIGLLEGMSGVETVAELIERRLLTVLTDRRRRTAAIGHPMYAEVLLGRLNEQQRQEPLDAVADGIEATGARRAGDALLVATCRVEAGSAIGPEELAGAAERALALFDYELAESFARHPGAANDQRCGVLLYRALSGQRRFEDADALVAEMLRSATGADGRAMVKLEAAAALIQQRHDPGAALAHLEAGLAEETSPGVRLQLTVQQIVSDFILGNIKAAHDRLELIPGRDALPPPVQARFVTHAAGIHLYRADFPAAMAASESARRIEQRLGRLGWLDHERSRFCELVAHSMLFDPMSTLEMAEANGAKALAHSEEGAAIALLGLQFVAWIAGQLNVAEEATKRWAYASQRSTDRLTDQPGYLFGALIAADRGDATTFGRRLETFQNTDLMHNTEPLGSALVARQVASAGDFDGAAALLVQGASIAIVNESRLFGSIIARELTLIGHPAEAVEILEPIVTVGGSESILDWWLAQANCLAAGDKAGLVKLATRFVDAGYLMDAANTIAFAAQLTPSPLDRLILSLRARRWLDLANGVSPRLDAVELPVSNREVEIVLAASRGLTNRQIGDEFVLSPRTVANHLHRSYQKLGLTREDLAEAFVEFR